MSLNKALTTAEAAFAESLNRLFSLLRIPSISTDPAHNADCDAAAQWLVKELIALGFKAEARPTAGRSMVVAHFTPKAASAKTPHALFYGHYDVQPVDPVELWHSQPFEPENRNGKLYGRGTSDDKGQLMTFIEAARAWIDATGDLPIKATFLIEGEEESGSPSLIPFLKASKKELSCDIAFVCDTNMWDEKTPAITTRLRGLVHEEVEVSGPAIDLHSGLYGGPAVNPLKALSRMLAALHDKNGKVQIPGFYDGVAPLPKATKKQWASLKFSEKKFLGALGLKHAAGEKGFNVLEQIWARPTAEVNGMWGGYTGAGTKTVIPSRAFAKFTFRLVGKQNPEQVSKAFRAFVKARLPTDVTAQFTNFGASPAIVLPTRSEALRRARRALEAEWGKPAVLAGAGGSIPIVGVFKRELNMDALMVGFGLDDDAIHSPNEKYERSSFHKGARSWARILAAIGA